MITFQNSVMKNSTKYFSLVLAAGVAGVALFTLVNASFTAFLRADTILATSASLAFLGFAVYDFSHRPQPLKQPGRVLRPTLREFSSAPDQRQPIIKSYRKERIAA